MEVINKETMKKEYAIINDNWKIAIFTKYKDNAKQDKIYNQKEFSRKYQIKSVIEKPNISEKQTKKVKKKERER